MVVERKRIYMLFSVKCKMFTTVTINLGSHQMKTETDKGLMICTWDLGRNTFLGLEKSWKFVFE